VVFKTSLLSNTFNKFKILLFSSVLLANKDCSIILFLDDNISVAINGYLYASLYDVSSYICWVKYVIIVGK
jgi:hypothetical protein